jgi:multidrug efflux pump subunit AcrA (membrane-fusion protein)
VDLAFESSGKITEINFEEGTFVKKGQLLAKVNDKPLQAQLQRLVSQLKLAEDRVFRQNALLERDAVSKEAYEQVKTELEQAKAELERKIAALEADFTSLQSELAAARADNGELEEKLARMGKSLAAARRAAATAAQLKS